MIEVLGAVAPPFVTLGLFALVVRAIVTADRRERKARARIDEELSLSPAPPEPEKSGD